jgi:SAM-dependent methyltransferase
VLERGGNGAPPHRRWVGPQPQFFDVLGAYQFMALVVLGLREHHYVLDIGCGALRAGRLLIPYLLPGRYFALEPNRSVVEDAIRHESSPDLVASKRPTFRFDDSLDLTQFGRRFDFLLAISVFSHAPQAAIRQCLTQAAGVLSQEGAFVATYVEGTQSYDGDEWVGSAATSPSGRVAYEPELMDEMIHEAGLKALTLEWSPGTSQRWIVLVPRRRRSLKPIRFQLGPPQAKAMQARAAANAALARLGRQRQGDPAGVP